LAIESRHEQNPIPCPAFPLKREEYPVSRFRATGAPLAPSNEAPPRPSHEIAALDSTHPTLLACQVNSQYIRNQNVIAIHHACQTLVTAGWVRQVGQHTDVVRVGSGGRRPRRSAEKLPPGLLKIAEPHDSESLMLAGSDGGDLRQIGDAPADTTRPLCDKTTGNDSDTGQ
jgi:hypothetical protein